MNCMAKISKADNFCPQCGQENNTIRNTIGMVIKDSLSNFFSLDARVFHSLIPLFTKPGHLSLEWRRGKRIQYLTPSRIYFVSSILLFLFLSLNLGNAGDSFAEGFKEGIADNEDVTLEDSTSISTNEKIDLGILDLNIDTSKIQDTVKDNSIHLDFTDTQWSRLYKLYKKDKAISSKDALAQLEIEDNLINSWLSAQSKKIANFDSDDFKKFYQSKLPIVLFFLLPVMALVLRLIYFKQDVYYSEHLVFAFHTQAVFFFALLLMSIADYFDSEFFTKLSLYYFIWYLIVALKRFYQESWGRTVGRFLQINLAFFVTAIFFFSVASIIVFSIY